MTDVYPAQLEIDRDRGVIYVHLTRDKDMIEFGSATAVRICQIEKPIPKGHIDITHMVGCCVVGPDVPKKKREKK